MNKNKLRGLSPLLNLLLSQKKVMMNKVVSVKQGILEKSAGGSRKMDLPTEDKL
jgi:hypothetical protein